MTDALKPCQIDEGHRAETYTEANYVKSYRARCTECDLDTAHAVWQSLPRNEKPKPRPRTKEELARAFQPGAGSTYECLVDVVTAAREDIAAMLRTRGDTLMNGIADEIERMP